MFRLPWRRDPGDFADELRTHIELEEARLAERGVPSDEAHRLARVRFGNAALANERVYEASRLPRVDALWQDLRYGVRTLRRSPGFAAAAILVLALGIGVNTALFSIVNGLFFRHVNVPEPDRLLYLNERNEWGQVLGVTSPAAATFLRDAGNTLAEFTAHWNIPGHVSAGGTTSVLAGELVESNYFHVVGAPFELGRSLRPEDDEPGSVERSIVISHDARVMLFGTDRDVLGVSVRVDAQVYRVVGVTAAGFTGLSSPWDPTMWWTTVMQAPAGRVGTRQVARLKDGVPATQFTAMVNASMPVFLQQQWDRWPPRAREELPHMRRRSIALASVNDVQVPNDPERQLIPTAVLAAVILVVALVLVIASANVAGLLLARGAARTGEIAMRQALGASRPRLFRQVVTESLVLSVFGALGGAAVSITLVRVFAAVTPARYVTSAALDARVLLFGAAVCVMTGLAVGLAPAIQSTRIELLQALGVGVVGARRTGAGLRRWVVVPQIAVSLVLLLVAAAHVRALRQMALSDLGYRTHNAAVLGVGQWSANERTRFVGPRGPEAIAAQALAERQFARAVLQQAAGAPDVAAFALTSRLPLSDAWLDDVLLVEQGAFRSGDAGRVPATVFAVSDGYFNAMGMRVLAGRPFDSRDGAYDDFGRRVAIVSASAARRLAPGGDILGKTVADVSGSGGRIDWLTVVGVVNDVDPVLNDGREHPAIYASLLQQWRPDTFQVVLRASGDLQSAVTSMNRAVLGASTFAEVTSERTLDELTAEILYPRRLGAGILVMAGLIGLLLSCIGLYGVVSCAAAQRTREIGIRTTLGATRAKIVGFVLREAVVVLVLGVSLGLVAAFFALRLSASVVNGLPTWDVLAFVVTPTLLAAVVLAACLEPALRASRIDPAEVIRGA